MRRPTLVGLLLATSLGCTPTGLQPKKPVPVAPKASGPAPTAQVDLAAAHLTGKVKLLSDSGGKIVSNNGGQVLSDNGLGLVDEGGNGVVSDNGLGLVSKARYGTLADKPPTEALLADAKVVVVDAAGRPVKDAAGKPIEATTDRTGTYAITAELPAQALVLKIKLWNGGELSALLPRGGAGAKREQAVDTATSLGAAYVLDQYVKGSQAVLDKLPQAETDRLHGNLRTAAAGLFAKAPAYQPGELVGAVEQARKAPEVDKALGDIKAILLGQANLGAGLQALAVPLTDPRALAPDGQGGYYVAEGVPGRIRHVAADGTVSIFADQLHGTVKQNFYGVVDMLLGTDGALYVAGGSSAMVWRIKPGGQVEVVAGTGKSLPAAVGKPAAQADLRPQAMAQDADGTLWIGEFPLDGNPSKVLSIGADGVLREPASPGWPVDWRMAGLARGGDGALYGLAMAPTQGGKLYRLAPGAPAWLPVPWKVTTDTQGDLAPAPDGGLILSDDLNGRVQHVAMDGTVTTWLDAGAGSPIKRPTDLLPWPDGRVRVIDFNKSQVFELDPAHQATAIAGATAVASGDAISLNGPFGAAVDAAGLLYIVEPGGHRVERWDGKALTTVAGGIKGFAGDGGPAKDARFDEPSTVAIHDGKVLIYDRANGRLREIAADGTVTTRLGGKNVSLVEAGKEVAPEALDLRSGGGLVVGPDGLPIFTVLASNQVLRQGADGRVRLLAGAGKGSSGDGGPAAQAKLASPGAMAFGPDGALYLLDAGNMRIRRIPDINAPSPTIEAFAGLDGLAAITKFSADPLPDGPRAQAVFAFPSSLCFDKAGNLYVAEFGTLNLPLLAGVIQGLQDLPLASLPKVPARVRKIAPDGTVSTVAGPGGKFFADTSAGDALVLPTSLAIDAQGRLVIVDAGANLVRFLPAGSF